LRARIEKLCELPGLHATERQALSDALTGLRALERQGARHEEYEGRIAETVIEKIRMIAPEIQRMEQEGT
jgi:hypothetical protein